MRWISVIALGLMLPASLHAKVAQSVRDQIATRFPPAIAHRGLESAQAPIEPQKLRGFVVLERDGLPAEKAYWFITNQDYEYRPAIIDGEMLTTRRGSTYTYLKRGQVMAIAGIEYSGNTVYFKLLSVESVARAAKEEKHSSRVATMLGFKLTKTLAAGAADPVLQLIEGWLKPFPDRASAEAYAAQLALPKAPPQK